MAAVGLTMCAGSALAARSVDPAELVGAWDATVEAPDGEATVRVVFAGNGTYLALAIMLNGEDPVPFWESGEWEVDDDTLMFEATASSQEMDEADRHTELTIESLDEGVLDVSSDEDPMWDQFDFHRVMNPVVGAWAAETDEGPAVFLMDAGGGFAGGLGDSEEHMETFWGTWTLDDDQITFAATDQSWEAGEEPELEAHTGVIEDMDDESMVMLIEGLSEEEIDWERIARDPLVGEWRGESDEGRYTVEISEDATFTVSMRSQNEREEFSGIWTVVGPGLIYFGVTEGDPESMLMHFVLTSPSTVLFGESDSDMVEFERR